MASATSSISQVKTGTSVRNRKTSYYKTEVTTLADGSIKRETYRTDSKGNNNVKISEATVDKDGNITSESVTSNATTNEKRALQQPNSQLSSSIKQQTKEAGDKAQANSIDPGGALDKAGGGSGNDANNPEQGDSQAAPETQATTPSTSQNLIYPLTMPGGQDVIQFTALTYKTKEIDGFTFGNRPRVAVGGGGSRSVGTVTLPIQSGIKDQNAAQWSPDEMDPAKVGLLDVTSRFIKDGDKTGAEDALKKVQEFPEQFQKGVAAMAVGALTGIQNVLGRTTGEIINPNLELLFTKPSLRPFTFTFRLSPRSADEGKRVVQIIRFFKKNMAPQRGGGANLFLKAPNTFQVHYLYRGDDQGGEHKFIGMMKECAITNFDVDYTPENNYATLKDGYMPSYVLNITMKELEPVFYEDYEDESLVPSDAIGY